MHVPTNFIGGGYELSKKRFRKGLGLVMTVMLITSILLTGCGGASNGSESKTKSEPITITFWNPDTRQPFVDVLNKIIKEFNVKNPNVTVEVSTVPFDQYDPKLQAAFLTKTLPDLVYTYRGYAADWGYQGLTAPVTDVIKNIGENQFPASELALTKVDNNFYSVPYIVYPHIVYYRTDWFKEKGLNPPKTWDDLLVAAKTLTDGKRYGILLYNKNPEPLVLLDLMATNNAVTFDQNNKVAINSPETIEALQMFKDLAQYSPPGSMTKGQQDQRLAFLDGQGAMMITSPSMADIINSKPGMIDKFGAVALPINKGKRGALAEFAGWGVASSSKHPAEAKKFIEFFMSNEQYPNFAVSTVIGHLPVLKSVTEGTAYYENPRIKPFVPFFKAGVETSKNGALPGQDFGPNKYAGSVMSQQIWSQMGDMLVVQNKTPQEVAIWAQKKIEELVKEIGK